jgi:MFS superfamily sulfate permease-like transporter
MDGEAASPHASASGERVRDGYRKGASPFRSPASGSIAPNHPVSKDLRGYRRATLRGDLPAGLTVAARAIPSGIHALKELIGSLQDEGITLVVARLKRPMQQTFQDVGLLDLVGEGHVYATVRAAVQAAHPAREGA